jgi:hypothetical protein
MRSAISSWLNAPAQGDPGDGADDGRSPERNRTQQEQYYADQRAADVEDQELSDGDSQYQGDGAGDRGKTEGIKIDFVGGRIGEDVVVAVEDKCRIDAHPVVIEEADREKQ